MSEFKLDKVAIKYILGTFRDEKGFPTGEDIIYLMTKRASDKGKNLNPTSFTTTVLFKMLSSESEDQAKLSIKELEEASIISEGRETKTGISYTILTNPYI
jgi:hypothetical protein